MPPNGDGSSIERELGRLAAATEQYKSDREILLDLVSAVATLAAEMKQARKVVDEYDVRCEQKERRVSRLEFSVASLWVVLATAGVGFWQYILPHITFSRH